MQTTFLSNAAAAVFWCSLGVVLYVYVGYPLLVTISAGLFGRRRAHRDAVDPTPFVSIIIAAHNEESVIEERLHNLLALDYPRDRMEIIVASDGSTDRTCDLVRAVASPAVRLFEFTKNRGKSATLADAVAGARGEILVLSDANTMMDADAVRRMTTWFADPQVGVVCGRLVLVDSASGQNADGLYWRFETALKEAEASLGALLGANGAIYAMRRSLFPELPSHIAVDDFVIPLMARLASGSALVYDAQATAHEDTPPEIRAEFARRSRIGAGGFQSLAVLWPLLNPKHGWLAVAFLSHKVLRWVCPFFLLGAMIGSAARLGSPVYTFAFLMQASLYAFAMAGYVWPRVASVSKLMKLPTLFAAMNLALLSGFFVWAFGRQTGVWQRTARSGA